MALRWHRNKVSHPIVSEMSHFSDALIGSYGVYLVDVDLVCNINARKRKMKFVRIIKLTFRHQKL